MNWKMLALGLARLMGIGAVVGVTVLVMKHGQSTGQQALVDAPQAPPSEESLAPSAGQSMAWTRTARKRSSSAPTTTA